MKEYLLSLLEDAQNGRDVEHPAQRTRVPSCLAARIRVHTLPEQFVVSSVFAWKARKHWAFTLRLRYLTRQAIEKLELWSETQLTGPLWSYRR